jgi:hypothetical protein
LHKFIGPSRIALPQHPGDADGQHTERGEHQDTDQDREETVHTDIIGFEPDFWRAVRVRLQSMRQPLSNLYQIRNCVDPADKFMVVPADETARCLPFVR